MFKGSIHTHSTYSDGEFTLTQLRRLLVADGCAFVCMTDHAEAFDYEKLRAYVSECESLSDHRFRFIAGLEYECRERMHILGLGVTLPVATKDPEEVIRHIDSQGGVSVIAHPLDEHFEWIESFEVLPHGVESWNSKYDGRYAPRPDTLHLISRLQNRQPDIGAFYGQDLHWKKQYRGLFNLVKSQTTANPDILAAFARGDYVGVKGDVILPSNGRFSQRSLERFARMQTRSERLRRAAKTGKMIANRCGVCVPAPLKTQLRRIF